MSAEEAELKFGQAMADGAVTFAATVLLNLYPAEVERLMNLIEMKDDRAIASMLLEAAARSSKTRPDPEAIRAQVADRVWPSEAARFLGIEHQQLRTMADDGRIPCTRSAGGVRQFSRRVLEELKPRISELLAKKKRR